VQCTIGLFASLAISVAPYIGPNIVIPVLLSWALTEYFQDFFHIFFTDYSTDSLNSVVGLTGIFRLSNLYNVGPIFSGIASLFVYYKRIVGQLTGVTMHPLWD